MFIGVAFCNIHRKSYIQGALPLKTPAKIAGNIKRLFSFDP